ncbi:hypothetical protein FHX48_001999 [Microbacterium halimionae]|uniref:Uncharacterized protein n=1 Tax=Microbacterium halimionae TaxID=1526413 RepID=A0A7W3JQ27_9MICO|nr:hypothetical protein [Microbacterium halimionae]MBA8816906.1 hypothetical protein [Microbacterium halimionae]NII94798.1 hypothetical protein [Microbacterium halimionae]
MTTRDSASASDSDRHEKLDDGLDDTVLGARRSRMEAQDRDDDTFVSARKPVPDADIDPDDVTVIAARRSGVDDDHATDDETFIASRKARTDTDTDTDDDTFVAARGEGDRSKRSVRAAETTVAPEAGASSSAREIYRPRAAAPAMVVRAAPAPTMPQASVSGIGALRQARRRARRRAIAVAVGASILIVAVIVLIVALVV